MQKEDHVCAMDDVAVVYLQSKSHHTNVNIRTMFLVSDVHASEG